MKNSVAIGLRAKTGRAIVVVLGGSADSPTVLLKEEIRLVDPKIPGTAQPYHEVMDLRWEESQREVQKYARAIERVAAKELARLIERITKDGATVTGAGVVGAKDRDLARIGNNHIRAHAAEGILFRSVLEFAAEKNGLPLRAFSDRDFATITKAELGQRHSSVARQIDDLRRSVSAPWRTDEKQAAFAAWLVLNGK
jgi:hypothetical protein